MRLRGYVRIAEPAAEVKRLLDKVAGSFELIQAMCDKADIDRARVSNSAQLEDLREQLAAAGAGQVVADSPVALLSPEALAAHRVDAERAAALERDTAMAGADDVADFSFTDIGGGFLIVGNHRAWHVLNLNHPAHKTLSLAPPPSTRFPDGFPGVA